MAWGQLKGPTLDPSPSPAAQQATAPGFLFLSLSLPAVPHTTTFVCKRGVHLEARGLPSRRRPEREP